MNEQDALIELEYLKKTRSQMPNGGAILRLYEGQLGDGYRLIASFESQKQGEKLLKQAGFKNVDKKKDYSDWK